MSEPIWVWRGERTKDGVEWALEVEVDRFELEQPMVVTVSCWDSACRQETLALLTAPQAREIAQALTAAALRVERANLNEGNPDDAG